MSNLMERQHGIGSYNKGCRCPRCRSACREHSRAYRNRKRIAEGSAKHPCFICDLAFASEAAALMHETKVH